MTEKTGKAYAFFDCSSSKEQIDQEIPFIRELVQTPNELELSLMELTENTRTSPFSEPELSVLMREAREANIKYIMEATYPSHSHRKTADELSAILNQAYQSPLYQEGEDFRGEVFYKENGRYVARE
jgi:hypothetical protein